MISRSATKSMEAGRSTTTRCSTTRPPTLPLPSSFKRTPQPSIPRSRSASTRAVPTTRYNNWLPDVLQQSVTQGFTIGFISDHNYVQIAGSESDSTLLLDTVSDPNSIYDWSVRAADYTSLLNQYLGAAAAKNVELLTTEFNSVNTNPGKQTTSLVNGLFIADSLGELMQTSYQGATVWDLRNGYGTSGNNSSSLYGWRDGGDYGLLGSPRQSRPTLAPTCRIPAISPRSLPPSSSRPVATSSRRPATTRTWPCTR